ncbi:unnamed protein product [Periconia digitata]|uniref:Major facilitator superfamily (MFS) profile domain-containing protein n=1 Tax=Periconia digitata TaxID=1303443 RepID=A0A9W4XU21_9PLEO|nr:unnamed protein product [Periconia digitata]
MASIELKERQIAPGGVVDGEPTPFPLDPAPTTAEDTPPPAHQQPSGIRLILLTIGIMTSIFLAALDSTIVTTAIPAITTEFGTISNIAWYGAGYGCTQTAFQSAWGKAYKYFPLKTGFLLAVAIFEAGNVICAVASSSTVLVLGRVVAGLGGGGVMTGAFTMVALSVKEEYRAAYMGVSGVTFSTASVVGPLMGGALTDGIGWRWCFWVSLPVGALAAFIVSFAFRSPIPPETGTIKERLTHLDLHGGVLIAGFLCCFVYAMHWGGTHPWSSASVIGTLFGFSALCIAFVVNEWWMGDKAMVQGRFLRNRVILSNLGFVFFLAGLFFPLLYTLPVQYQSVDGASASQSGIRLIPLVMGVSVFTLVANGILTYWRHYRPFLVLGSVLGTAGAVCIYTMNAQPSPATWIGFELLTAVGVGLALQVPMLSNQTCVGVGDIASITAITLFVENCGTTLFVASNEAAFTKSLIESLAKNIPSLNPETVLNAGATQLRHVFAGLELEGVLQSYLDGSKVSHILPVACGIVACLISGSDASGEMIRWASRRWRKAAE